MAAPTKTPKIDPDDGFVQVPRREVPSNTPAPSYPANTPVANPTIIGDAPYTRPSPYSPEQQGDGEPQR